MTLCRRVFFCFCMACLSLNASAQTACEDPNPLRFSMAPSVAADVLLKEFRPLLEQLEKSLGRKVVVTVPTSYNAIISEILSGNIDLASMGPASYSIAKNRDPSITAFATRTLRGGTFTKPDSATYNSLLVTLKSRGIADIDALAGKTVMLSDPASTSGAVIPREEFGAMVDKPLEQFFGKVGYSGSHDRSLEALSKGNVDAVFVASERLDDAIRNGKLSPAKVAVLWQSKPIPHDPFVYRGKLCPALQEKIRNAFFGQGAQSEQVLDGLHAGQFAPIGDDDYLYLRNLLTPGK